MDDYQEEGDSEITDYTARRLTPRIEEYNRPISSFPRVQQRLIIENLIRRGRINIDPDIVYVTYRREVQRLPDYARRPAPNLEHHMTRRSHVIQERERQRATRNSPRQRRTSSTPHDMTTNLDLYPARLPIPRFVLERMMAAQNQTTRRSEPQAGTSGIRRPMTRAYNRQQNQRPSTRNTTDDATSSEDSSDDVISVSSNDSVDVTGPSTFQRRTYSRRHTSAGKSPRDFSNPRNTRHLNISDDVRAHLVAMSRVTRSMTRGRRNDDSDSSSWESASDTSLEVVSNQSSVSDLYSRSAGFSNTDYDDEQDEESTDTLSSTSSGRSQFDNMPSTSTGRRGRIENLPSTSSGRRGLIENLPSTSSGRRGRIENLPSTSSGRRGRIENMPSKCSDRQDCIENVPSTSSGRRGRIENMPSKSSDRQDCIENLPSTSSGRRGRIENMPPKSSDRQDCIENVPSTSSGRRGRIENLPSTSSGRRMSTSNMPSFRTRKRRRDDETPSTSSSSSVETIVARDVPTKQTKRKRDDETDFSDSENSNTELRNGKRVKRTQQENRGQKRKDVFESNVSESSTKRRCGDDRENTVRSNMVLRSSAGASDPSAEIQTTSSASMSPTSGIVGPSTSTAFTRYQAPERPVRCVLGKGLVQPKKLVIKNNKKEQQSSTGNGRERSNGDDEGSKRKRTREDEEDETDEEF